MCINKKKNEKIDIDDKRCLLSMGGVTEGVGLFEDATELNTRCPGILWSL